MAVTVAIPIVIWQWTGGTKTMKKVRANYLTFYRSYSQFCVSMVAVVSYLFVKGVQNGLYASLQ